MNLIEELKEKSRRIQQLNAARSLFKLLYPYDKINLNKALYEYNELMLDTVEDTKKLEAIRNETNEDRISKKIAINTSIKDLFHKKIPCPKCGRLLNFRMMKTCRFENPEGYSCLFFCYPIEFELYKDNKDTEEFCGYYVGFFDNIITIIENKDNIFSLKHIDGEL
jgi:hypothetical protein